MPLDTLQIIQNLLNEGAKRSLAAVIWQEQVPQGSDITRLNVKRYKTNLEYAEWNDLPLKNIQTFFGEALTNELIQEGLIKRVSSFPAPLTRDEEKMFCLGVIQGLNMASKLRQEHKQIIRNELEKIAELLKSPETCDERWKALRNPDKLQSESAQEWFRPDSLAWNFCRDVRDGYKK